MVRSNKSLNPKKNISTNLSANLMVQKQPSVWSRKALEQSVKSRNSSGDNYGDPYNYKPQKKIKTLIKNQ
jgi:hypothetical protein